ncbi:hypothetical protein RI129_012837 [Pyrocoelia pectoralis]|uniref:CRAL-TRIO domain-containing protein n=1 Tax=Pyrocoelia pectoralis TaxID=417401 RepID=A0AAN7ZCG5_9COLE
MNFDDADVEFEYKKRKELRREDVEYLKEWLKTQQHLPKIDDLEIIFFLTSCSYSIEMTKRTIDKHYTLKGLCPEIFKKRDLKTWKETLNAILMLPLPKLTHEGYQIFYTKINNPDPNKYVFVDNVKCGEVIMKMTLRQRGTVNGLVFVLDLDGYSLAHIAGLPLMELKILMTFLQEALPIQLKQFHCINGGRRLDKIMLLVKPFLKKEMSDLIYVHSDYAKTLYNYLPQECIPKELGGSSESIHHLQEEIKAFIFNRMELIEADEQLVVDESKRVQKSYKFDHLFGIEGTFRKLELD